MTEITKIYGPYRAWTWTRHNFKFDKREAKDDTNAIRSKQSNAKLQISKFATLDGNTQIKCQIRDILLLDKNNSQMNIITF